MVRIFLILILSCCSSILFAQKADAILGTWLPSGGKAHIKIDRTGNSYHGTIIWLEEPLDPETKKPQLDANNPEKALQSRPVIGIRLLKNLVFEDSEWTNGIIYDPKSGKTYSCNVTLIDANTLEMRGYVGFSFIGRSDTWKRLK